MIFHVASYTPLPEGAPVDAVKFDSELTTAQLSGVIPGGFGGLSLGYKAVIGGEISGFLTDPINFVDLGHIQVFAGSEKGFLVYEGRIQKIGSPTGQQATSVTATGYGAGTMAATTDMWYFADQYDGEPLVAGGQLLREVLKASAPLLKIGDADDWFEPGGSYLRSTESGRNPNSVVDEVTKAGDFLNRQVLFSVYENRVARLYPRVPPVDPLTGEITAHYFVPMDKKRVTWERDGSLLVGVVAAQFKDPTTTTADHTEVSSAAEQVLFRDAHGGLLRGFLLPSSSWTKEQAEFARDSYLAKYKNPVITVMINADDKEWPVYDRMGGVIPAYIVREGEWIQVADADPLMITSVHKDLMAKTVAIVASTA